jgi:glycosyltransferase domain-containing protein
VIVFSRQRQDRLIRSLKLWSQQPFRFIILDNSIKPLKINFANNINYYHSPGLNYGTRALEAVQYLNNPYSIICGDDESLVPYSINFMISFLEKNKNFASVGGKVIAAYNYGPRVIGRYAYEYMYGYVNQEKNSRVRIEKHFAQEFNGQIPICGMYRLFRRNGITKLLESFFSARDVATPYIFQILAEIVCTSIGPNSTVSSVYLIRNWNNEMSNHSDWNRNATFSSWWSNTIYQTEKVELMRNICEINKIDASLLHKILDGLAIKLTILDDKVSQHNFNQYKFAKLKRSAGLIKFLVKRILKPESIPKSLEKMLDEESNELPLEEKIQIIDCTRMILGQRN